MDRQGKYLLLNQVLHLPYQKRNCLFDKTGGSDIVKVNGTCGLPWTVSPSVETNGITPGIISSETDGADQILTFTAAKNTGNIRSVIFTIAVTGGDHSKTVEVKQDPVVRSVTIDQSVLESYYNQMITSSGSWAKYPPFLMLMVRTWLLLMV